jgi:hypothetical protein
MRSAPAGTPTAGARSFHDGEHGFDTDGKLPRVTATGYFSCFGGTIDCFSIGSLASHHSSRA